jgi:hypothetical protein
MDTPQCGDTSSTDDPRLAAASPAPAPLTAARFPY